MKFKLKYFTQKKTPTCILCYDLTKASTCVISYVLTTVPTCDILRRDRRQNGTDQLKQKNAKNSAIHKDPPFRGPLLHTAR